MKHNLIIQKQIFHSGNTKVYLGKLDGLKVAIKTHLTKDYKIHKEFEVYELFSTLGVNIPKYWLYNLSDPEVENQVKSIKKGSSLLVLEYLEKLKQGREDIPKLYSDISETLEKIHPHCIHNGIKPLNIMKKGGTYILIDFASSTFEKKGDGFVRKSWVKNFACQPRIKGIITKPKHDYEELRRVCEYLKN